MMMNNFNSDITKIIFDHHVFLTQKFGGISRYFIELYKEFSERDDVIVNIPLKYAINEYAKKEHIDYISVRDDIAKKKYLYKYYAYRNQCTIKKYLNENSVDILHSTWYSEYVFKLKGNHKRVFTVHDMIQELFYQDVEQFDIARKKRAIFESDIVIADSNNTKNDILKLYPEVNENKIRVIHLGVNNLLEPKQIN
ncbi:MAG: glycosyltransferase, partial [Clostridia bacterium]|nr:glycosyltransferase [Clostridia bacterium]